VLHLSELPFSIEAEKTSQLEQAVHRGIKQTQMRGCYAFG